MKPMLAATVEDLSNLRFPVLASPKLDGIRALIIDGQVMSRNLKPIPNLCVQETLGSPYFNGFDGELIVGKPNDAKKVFRKTSSAVRSVEGEPRVVFHAFDLFNLKRPFQQRLEKAKDRLGSGHRLSLVKIVPHKLVTNLEDLLKLQQQYEAEGYEGIMTRDPEGYYKHGRSTPKEQGLVKIKQFLDAEAVVIGIEELMENRNEQTRDELGRAKRSSHKANLRGKGLMGSLKVIGLNGPNKNMEFNIGSGFDLDERRRIWNHPIRYVDRVVTYKYFSTGSKDKPRFPVFLRWFDE